MTREIFLSYSHSDAPRAVALASTLRERGLSVWIDESGIDGAQNWTTEIVGGINDCKTFLVLLSNKSVSSHNVARELQLALDRGKHILPIVLEDLVLPPVFEYPLAGVQRLAYSDVDSIVRALERLNASASVLSSFSVRSTAQVARDPSIKRLAVLPFDDQSPSHDNEWFASGMVDELISTLGSLSGLVVPGRSSVMVYKTERPRATVIGQELDVQYIVEGAVRKAGEKIRITASLTDAVRDVQLWTGRFDGSFDDIFDFQERVALQITEGLRLILTPEDVKIIERKVTENAEAYQLFIKAQAYFNRNTKQDMLYAAECLSAAVELDPAFAAALALLARIQISLYEKYDRIPSRLEEAADQLSKARALDPEQPFVYQALMNLHRARGEYAEAISAGVRYVEIAPKLAVSHFQLGFLYDHIGENAEAVRHYEKALELSPSILAAHLNLCIQLKALQESERMIASAQRGLPFFESHLKRNPDDQFQKMSYALLLDLAGRTVESRKIIDALLDSPLTDGYTTYCTIGILLGQGAPARGLDAFKLAVERGFRDVANIRSDSELAPLRELPEFIQIMNELEASTAADRV